MNVTLIQVCQRHHHLDHEQTVTSQQLPWHQKTLKKTTRVSKLVAELTGKEITCQKEKKKHDQGNILKQRGSWFHNLLTCSEKKMANAASIRIAKSLFLMASEERAAGWGYQWFGRSQHDKQTKKTHQNKPNQTTQEGGLQGWSCTQELGFVRVCAPWTLTSLSKMRGLLIRQFLKKKWYYYYYKHLFWIFY